MATIVITSVENFPNDIAIVSGTVDGISTQTQVWQSAIAQATNPQSFIAQALSSSISPSPTPITDLTGTVTI